MLSGRRGQDGSTVYRTREVKSRVLFTLHVNPEILRVNEKFNTEILRVKHCVLTTLLGVSNSPG